MYHLPVTEDIQHGTESAVGLDSRLTAAANAACWILFATINEFVPDWVVTKTG